MKIVIRALVVLTVLCFTLSCSGLKATTEETKAVVQLKTSVVTCASGGIFITVDVPGEWTVALDFLGQQPWATLGVTSGIGKRVDVDMYYEDNTDEENDRKLKIIVSYSGGTITREFIQYSLTSSDRVTGWMELPEVVLNDNLYFFYHHQELASGKKIRSWSYLFDVHHLVSHWVAYPLNKELIGKGDRTDAWGLDPKLPRTMQPVLLEPYSNGSYHRGHQIPSADRLNKEANEVTFYGTNMTPQLNAHNEGIWSDLEGKVRSIANNSDTTYVVTGVIVSASSKKEKDSYGKSVTIPDAYFKVLLRYGKSSTLGQWNAAAFYLEHRSYSGSIGKEHSMSVDELEELTGFDFFVNLPAKVGADQAAKIEAVDPAGVALWW